MLLCFQIRVNFTLVLCIACYHFEFGIAAKVVKYLQAEWETASSKDLVLQYVLSHPDWRVSIQTHKLLGVR
jgi:organic radical activating enzyme